MRAVIVELNKELAAVLSDDGCIVTIKNKNYEIGQVIQMSNPHIQLAKKITAFAASAAAFVILGVGAWAYASPYSYVSLDVNPSVEFTLNRFDRVIKVTAVNDDGQELINEITLNDLENKTIEDAITNTVQQISELGYFEGEEEGGLVIATSGQDLDKAEALAEELQDTVETKVTEISEEVAVETISVGLERVEEAHELGITPGKLNLIEKLQAVADDPASIKVDEWMDRPVKEIMKATKDFKKYSSEVVEDTANADQPEAQLGLENSSLDKATKEAKKAKDIADKAAEKAKEAEEKAVKKADEAKNKANEAALKAEDKEKKIAQKAAKEAEKEAEAAKKAAEKAKKDAAKAAEKAKIQADKAVKIAQEAADASEENDDAIEDAKDKDKKAAEPTKEADKKDDNTKNGSDKASEKSENNKNSDNGNNSGHSKK